MTAEIPGVSGCYALRGRKGVTLGVTTKEDPDLTIERTANNGDDDAAKSMLAEFGDPPEGQYLDLDEKGRIVNIPLYMRETRARAGLLPVEATPVLQVRDLTTRRPAGNGDEGAARSMLAEFGDPPEGQYLDFDANGKIVNIPLYMREERIRAGLPVPDVEPSEALALDLPKTK